MAKKKEEPTLTEEQEKAIFQDCPWLTNNEDPLELDQEQIDAYKYIARANVISSQKLGKMGGGIDPLMLIQLRMDMLTEAILPSGRRERLHFETMWQERLGEILLDAREYVQRQRAEMSKKKLVLPESPFITGEPRPGYAQKPKED
jgi:hypothetical protein